MAEKSDYSPVVEERGAAESRRRWRFGKAMVLGAHTFWLYAVVLAGIILLVIYLTGGFGEGGDERNGAQAVAATSTDGTSPHSSSRR